MVVRVLALGPDLDRFVRIAFVGAGEVDALLRGRYIFDDQQERAAARVTPRKFDPQFLAVEHKVGLRHSNAHGANPCVLAVELDALHAVDNRRQPQLSLADDLFLVQVEADGELDVVDVYIAVLEVVRPVPRQGKGRGGLCGAA